MLNDRDDGVANRREYFGCERSDHSGDQGFVGRENFAGTYIADVPECEAEVTREASVLRRSSGGPAIRRDNLAWQGIDVNLSQSKHLDAVVAVQHGAVGTRFEAMRLPR